MTGNDEIETISEEDLWDQIQNDEVIDEPVAEDDSETEETESSDEEETESPDDEVSEDEEPEVSEDEEPESEPEVDYKALYEKANAEIKTTVGRLHAEQARFEQEREAFKAQNQTPPPPAEPTEEDAFLNQFKEEYSEDVLKAIDIISTRKAQQFATQLVQEKVAPLEKANFDAAERSHFGTIEAAHPDVYEINQSPEFEDWIQSRPPHVINAYMYTRERGSATEVIAMLNEYKSSKAPASAAATQQPKTRQPSGLAVQRRRGSNPVARERELTDEIDIWNSIPD